MGNHLNKWKTILWHSANRSAFLIHAFTFSIRYLFTEYSKHFFFLAFHTQTQAHARIQAFDSKTYTHGNQFEYNFLVHVPTRIKRIFGKRKQVENIAHRCECALYGWSKGGATTGLLFTNTHNFQFRITFFVLSNGHNHLLLSHYLSLYHMRCLSMYWCQCVCVWVTSICCCKR